MRISMIVFLSLSLYAHDMVALFDMALKQNYKVKSFLHQIQAQKLRYKESEEGLYPSIALSLSYGKDQYEYRYPTQTREFDEGVKGYIFSLKQPIYQPKIFALMRENSLKIRYVKLQKEEFLQSLYSEIARNFIEALKFQELGEIYQHQYKNYRSIYKTIQKKRALKIATITDELQAKAKMESIKSRLIANDLSFTQSILGLKSLTQVKNISIPQWKIVLKELAIDSKMIEENPQLKQYQLNLKIVQNEIRKRKYELYPNVEGSIRYSDTSSGDSITRRNNVRLFLELNMPLFNKPALTAIEEAKELYWQAKNDYLDLKNSLKQKREELLTKLHILQEQYRADLYSLESAKKFLLKAEKAFQFKLMSSTDYFSAQNDYYDAQQRVVIDKADILKTLIEIQSLHGQLSKSWIELFQRKYLEVYNGYNYN